MPLLNDGHARCALDPPFFDRFVRAGSPKEGAVQQTDEPDKVRANGLGPLQVIRVLDDRTMIHRFVVEDELHAEAISEHETYEAAISKLKALAQLPWDAEPNAAPCQGWRKCLRRYEVVEYEVSTAPWARVRTLPAFEVSAKGVAWDEDFTETLAE